ncbi:putative HNHc nuclease [Anaerocolumna chitinilytica]|uniref:HNHc nuclease n=1 Tax=Anaerocolumna chitinilytica TaxID=1727145 RepID=A0A7M3SAL4_9FIRM|nr:putative HNHc nuclease [Anaerocolumna chitinilytica]BCK01632.1 hypothetical protein bsdcttw_46720 [Anaerocolumna chitinilytica]
MYELANIKAYKVSQDGTYFNIFIPKRNLQETIESKNIRQCGVWLDDGRLITAEQRKKAYATMADISIHTGYLPEELKEWLKYLHISRTGCDYFSLSNCSVDRAREFINTILDYAIENGVILTDLAINRTDDINHILYACLKNSKCAVCGLKGEIHHWDAIGMGQDRKVYDDTENRKICLCRTHHTEAHTIGRDRFEEKYKVYGIKYNA